MQKRTKNKYFAIYQRGPVVSDVCPDLPITSGSLVDDGERRLVITRNDLMTIAKYVNTHAVVPTGKKRRAATCSCGGAKTKLYFVRLGEGSFAGPFCDLCYKKKLAATLSGGTANVPIYIVRTAGLLTLIEKGKVPVEAEKQEERNYEQTIVQCLDTLPLEELLKRFPLPV